MRVGTIDHAAFAAGDRFTGEERGDKWGHGSGFLERCRSARSDGARTLVICSPHRQEMLAGPKNPAYCEVGSPCRVSIAAIDTQMIQQKPEQPSGLCGDGDGDGCTEFCGSVLSIEDLQPDIPLPSGLFV
jgi:hypothetical protein